MLFSYISRRILYSIPLLLIISFVAFTIITLPPGDYLSIFINQITSQTGISQAEAQEMAAQLEEMYGLDQPFFVQYYEWITGIIFQGDFGFSFNYRKPVSEVIWPRLGMTVVIALGSHLVSVVIGGAIGIFSAIKKYGILDSIFTIIAFLGLSIPNFFFALVLMYIISVWFGGDVGGLFSPEYVMADWSLARFIDFLQHIWVPIVVVGTYGTARNMRVMRSNLLDVLNEQYVKVARAKGLKSNYVFLKHALRNAVQPIIMYMGMTLPFLIQGAIVTSIVLNLPTTGPVFYNALVNRDMYLAGSFLMMLAVMLVIGNILADILLAWIDPRVRY